MMLCQHQSPSTPNLTPAVRDIYQTLTQLTASRGKRLCKENLNTLVTKSGYCRRTVQRVLQELEQERYIRVERRYDKQGRVLANYYHLLAP